MGLMREAGATIALLCAAAAVVMFHPWVDRPISTEADQFLPLLSFLAYPLIIAGLERLFAPAGPRKSGRQWMMNFNIIISNYVISIPIISLLVFYEHEALRFLNISTGYVKIDFSHYGILGFISVFLSYSLAYDF